jgi:hypothetical protein
MSAGIRIIWTSNMNANIMVVNKPLIGALMLSPKALAATKHGMSRSRPYRIWRSMKVRCERPSERLARWYTGISYDPKWKFLRGFGKI